MMDDYEVTEPEAADLVRLNRTIAAQAAKLAELREQLDHARRCIGDLVMIMDKCGVPLKGGDYDDG